MDTLSYDSGLVDRRTQLLTTLEGLLAIPATEVKPALTQAAQLVAATLEADKVDMFLYEPHIDTLVAMGTSDTPMGRRQIALGLNRMALSNGGKTAKVFESGESFRSGHLDQDPEELRGIKEGLGIRSAIVVPLDVDGVRRGAIQVDAAQPERFTEEDVLFLKAVAHWVGLILHRTELAERLAREGAARARLLAAEDLITILAHDLRGPLTALKGRAMLIEMRAAREGHPAHGADAGAITRAASRLERIIGDLMDTAKLEHGLFTITPTVVDLVALVRETAETLQTSDNGITVRAPDELAVEVDPDRIRQLLENVLSNALKHSPTGVDVVVEVSTQMHESRAWAHVSVRDFGPGIAPELLPTLFRRFSAERRTTGLGLGLFLAHGIAVAHGGTLTAESPPGDGATFHLALPLPGV